MLKLIIGEEVWNEETEEFEIHNPVEVEFEHSLISLSKWESKFKKPFLSTERKTTEEVIGYLQAMAITPNLDSDVLLKCSKENVADLQAYIDSTESATTFGMMPDRRSPGEVITSELIYYWMVAFTVPWEAQYWHLNRLFALIRICNIKNSKPNERKVSKQELAERYRALNEKRKAELGTTG